MDRISDSSKLNRVKQWFLAIGACVAISSVSGISAGGPSPFSVQGQLAKTTESSSVSALKALIAPPGKSLTEVRRLGMSSQTSKVRRLLEIFEENQNHTDPLLKIELVRALSIHTKGAERDSVVRALLTLFEVNKTVVAESAPDTATSREFSSKNPGSLADLTREIAAMALARSQHPLAARVLILAAAEAQPIDPQGAQIARNALRAYPPSQTTRAALGALVDPRALDRLQKPPPLRDLPVFTPEALDQLAKNATDPLALSAPEQFPNLTTWRDVIEALDALEVWPEAFLNEKLWEKAAELEGPWTFRALALLSRGKPELQAFARKAARQALTTKDENRRSAAAFLLAVTAPKEARQYVSSKDALLRGPILSQAFSGELAEAAYRMAAPTFKILALSTSLHEPRTWDNWSTRSLWEHGGQISTNEWIAPLVSRMTSSMSYGGAPTVSQVKIWLNDRSPSLRAATIQGLEKNHSSSARGLLLDAYRLETELTVRRSICHAFFAQQLSNDPSVKVLTQLEPDPGCRALAEGKADPEARRFRILRAGSTPTEMIDRQGRAHQVFVAPDGFAGFVGADL